MARQDKKHIWRQTMLVLLVFTTIENIFKLNVLLIEFDWIELVLSISGLGLD